MNQSFSFNAWRRHDTAIRWSRKNHKAVDSCEISCGHKIDLTIGVNLTLDRSNKLQNILWKITDNQCIIPCTCRVSNMYDISNLLCSNLNQYTNSLNVSINYLQKEQYPYSLKLTFYMQQNRVTDKGIGQGRKVSTESHSYLQESHLWHWSPLLEMARRWQERHSWQIWWAR